MRRVVLITNLGGVNIGPVRTWTRALLLVENNEDNPTPFVARGFGTEASLELFTMRIPSLEYTFEREPMPPWFVDVPGAKLLSTHGKLRIRQGDDVVEMTLDCASLDGEPIHFETIDKPDVARLWRVLHARVVFYHRAPFIVIGRQVPTDLAREVTRGDLR